jgi:hypothetical protein
MWGALSDERTGRLQLLLPLACAVIFGSESRGTRDHILLSQIRDFPFRRLLRLAGLRWRYSTPPPQRDYLELDRDSGIQAVGRTGNGTCFKNSERCVETDRNAC